MKRILCYGDSNTWGYDPRTSERFDETVRWTGVLAHELGSAYRVIEEGLNGRTTVWDDPIEGYKNGHTYLIPCLATHAPLDLVAIMLGTNDLKRRFSLGAFDIAEGAGVLVRTVQQSEAGRAGLAPLVLLICPPPLAAMTGDTAELFEGGLEKSYRLAEHYARVAQELGCAFMDAGTVIRTSEIDGVHFEPEAHYALGRAVAAKIREIL